MTVSSLYLPPSVCPHPVDAVFGTLEPPDRLDVICRNCWGAFDIDSMPMDLLERLVEHVLAGHFKPLRAEAE
jgi:hypothetical protein